MPFFRNIKKGLSLIPGWRTNFKIIVIESDDWGSIRMPSREVYKKCLNAGYRVDKNPYERYDSLLSQKDLELLFDLLIQFRDRNGNHPIITANCVVANPDFEKIRLGNFETYYYELINETFKRYPEHSNNLNLWKKGIESKIFFPQFHAREHLNVSLFMDALKRRDPDVLFGFENQMPGSISRSNGTNYNYYIGSTGYISLPDKEEKLTIYLEGLDLFESIFGYKSESIIPTNYVWSIDYNKAIYEKGVSYIQGIRKICEPIQGNKNKYHRVYLGKKNTLGQVYLVRNAFFEPSLFNYKIRNPVEQCLSEIEIAFKMRKPAVITSHRINYVGFIDEANRDRTLGMLNKLLVSIYKKWPDVVFMNTVQLGKMINRSSQELLH